MEDLKIIKLQNKVRGHIATRKDSSKVYKGKSIDLLNENLRRNISETLFNARILLPINKRDYFIKWTYTQVKSQVKDFDSFSTTTYCDMAGLFRKMEKLPFHQEIEWMSYLIKNNNDKINAFIKLNSELEFSIFNSHYSKTIELLESFDLKYGASLTTIQFRVAVEQFFQGLQAQKKYSNLIRKKHKQGLLSFITYFTSVRNEDKTIFSKYVDDIKERVNNHLYYKNNTWTQNYLLYRLANVWPVDIDDITDVFMVEQTNSIIDMYETIVSFYQKCIYENKVEFFNLIENSLIEFNGIQDYRLVKIKLFLNGSGNGYSGINGILIRDTSIFDNIIGGESVSYLDIKNKIIEDNSYNDVWSTIYLSLVGDIHQGKTDLIDVVSRNLNLFLSSTRNKSKTYNDLIKLSVNFNLIKSVKDLRKFLEQIYGDRPSNNYEIKKISLNSPLVGSEEGYSCNNSSLSWRVWSNNTLTTDPKISIEISSLIESLVQAKKLNYSYSIKILDLIKSDSFIINNIRDEVLINNYFLNSNIDNILNMILDKNIIAEFKDRSSYLKIILNEFTEDQYAEIDNPLKKVNLLHFASILLGDDDLSTYTRRCIKQVCNIYEVSLPSEIKEISDKDEELINFLGSVCIPSNLELSRIKALSSTEKVNEERLKILEKLTVVDKKYSEIYRQEIMKIRYRMLLDEGQRLVAASRIHVDTEGFKKWAIDEISEDFDRYLDLLKIEGNIQNSDYSEILQNMIDGGTAESSFKPISDADALLMNIVRKLQNEFLFNSSFGLDFFLSKRIRHQSFIGMLRAPLEKSQLITTKTTENGSYRDNEYWLDKLCNSDNICRETLGSIFNDFSKSFDECLINLKDEKLQLRSEEKPLGLIQSLFSSNLVEILKVYFNSTLSNSLDTFIDLLWASINSSLMKTREYITATITQQIGLQFDKLKAQVKKELPNIESDFYDFDLKISQCGRDVQAALVEVGAWFTRSDLEAYTKFLSPDEIIQLAFDTAKKCLDKPLRNLNYNVNTINYDAELKIPFSNLPFINDVLFTLLNNVLRHSYLENPKIDCNISFNESSKTLNILMQNACSPKSKSKNISIVNEIRQLIDSNNFSSRTRLEGKSGLIKLANLANQSKQSYIKFDFIGDSMFSVDLVLSFVVKQMDIEEDK
ncbi:hypothetical protein [Acinetobacter bereziniae]|uniref:hypothetical protein n=1 Tax=Acinetobacter bereziniae TaxID=106648 RepID=UPI001900635F|nr:hypothetical protein [Acinetobacter bereziniae]MBJ8442703.1 hypothetical protein [Acinetobacter bereziniae]